jgi:signal transduction histidine kinase
MLKQAVSRSRLLPAGSLRSRQWDLPILEPLAAANRIVAFISHDLRHPLTAILANAEFLTRSDISELEKSDFYQEIRWAIDRMNEMVPHCWSAPRVVTQFGQPSETSLTQSSARFG